MRDRIRMKKCFLFLYHPFCMVGRWVKVNSDPSLFLSFLLSVTFMSNNRISSLGVTSSLFSSFLILLHSKIGRPFCFSLSLSLACFSGERGLQWAVVISMLFAWAISQWGFFVGAGAWKCLEQPGQPVVTLLRSYSKISKSVSNKWWWNQIGITCHTKP